MVTLQVSPENLPAAKVTLLGTESEESQVVLLQSRQSFSAPPRINETRLQTGDESVTAKEGVVRIVTGRRLSLKQGEKKEREAKKQLEAGHRGRTEEARQQLDRSGQNSSEQGAMEKCDPPRRYESHVTFA
ncbi:hypothetical protein V1264_016959 [Littorina saxatilis]|uniref:Uncharacterized protein n=1 Tax=Littorina saxatilis TaxID=31220 RepID=A0AAN9BH15_9CAEN